MILYGQTLPSDTNYPFVGCIIRLLTVLWVNRSILIFIYDLDIDECRIDGFCSHECTNGHGTVIIQRPCKIFLIIAQNNCYIEDTFYHLSLQGAITARATRDMFSSLMDGDAKH